MKPLKVAILTTDKREHERNYTEPAATFGTPIEALLQGLVRRPGVEVHLVACLQ